MRLRAGNQPAAGANDACGRTKLNAGQDFRIFKDTSLNISKNNTTLDNRLATSQCSHTRILSSVGQFARVVKGVDLRSTAGNCAWVRTPQLTFRSPLKGNGRSTNAREAASCSISVSRLVQNGHCDTTGRDCRAGGNGTARAAARPRRSLTRSRSRSTPHVSLLRRRGAWPTPVGTSS